MQTIPIHPLASADGEAARVLQICNACRYCEGFCAVFPAMTRRLEFAQADIHYLANLCHNCGACLHACQYAPPHAFAVNVPQAMARVRMATYADYAWPNAFGRLYRNNGVVLALALALVAALALFVTLIGSRALASSANQVAGDFYRVLPHNVMIALFAPVFVYALIALSIGAARFWRAAPPGRVSRPAALEATHDALRLRYLDGGHGDGCNEADDAFTVVRRRFHHCVFYGFMLCFAATCVATLYHYGLGWRAPYPATSLPKLLGIAGGFGVVIGCIGLFGLNLRRHPLHGAAEQHPMDRGFIALLFLTAASGLLLALVRTSVAMPALLAVHLGAVMALFVTLPYGKFVHGVYRGAALLKWAIERRQPNRLGLTDD